MNAHDALIIRAARQQITGTVREGAAAQRVIFENVVNTETVEQSAAGVAVRSDGTISLLAPGQSAAPAPTRTVRRMIVVDNSPATRTKTALQIEDGHVDITTQSVRGENAYNSFSIFNVFADQTVNMIVPSGVDNLINIVRDEATDIDGQLNALKEGAIGGNVYFLNPHGVVVGEAGVIRAGDVVLAAPSLSDIDDLLGRVDAPAQNDALALLSIGAMQRNDAGRISLNGQIITEHGATVAAANVEVTGDAVATGGAIGIAPKIVIYSADSTVLTEATVTADGANAGEIDIRSAGSIAVGAGTLISASGRGAAADGGSVVVFADEHAGFAANATIMAVGGEISGDGGFIEFSGVKSVDLAGGRFDVSVADGEAGIVLIDPQEIVISANTCLGCGSAYSGALSAGSDFQLEASHRIVIAQNVFLSTRVVDGATDRASHESGVSTGNSGNVTLTAPNIEMQTGSAIFAQAIQQTDSDGAATTTYNSGTINLKANASEGLFTDGSRIVMTNATIKGGNVALTARDIEETDLAFLVQKGDAKAQISLTKSTIEASGTAELTATARAVVEDVTLNYARPVLIVSSNSSEAGVSIKDTDITSGGNLSATATSESVSLASDLLLDALPIPVPLDAAVGIAGSEASVVVSDGSNLRSTGGDVALKADSRATVEAIGTARAIRLGGFSLNFTGALAVGVVNNTALVRVDRSAVTADSGAIDLDTVAFSQNETSFDVFGSGDVETAIAAGFNYTNHSARSEVLNASLTASGDIDVEVTSLQRAMQNGTTEIDDNPAMALIKLLDAVVTTVVDEFFTEDGSKTDTGESIDLWWTKTKSVAGQADEFAASFNPDYANAKYFGGDSSTTSGSAFALAAGVLIGINDVAAEVTQTQAGLTGIDAGGALNVTATSNVFSSNSAYSRLAYGGTGTGTTLSVGLLYEDVDQVARIVGDRRPDGGSNASVSAGSVKVVAGQFAVDDKGTDSDDDDTITFVGKAVSASTFGNGRSVKANTALEVGDGTGYSVGIAAGASFRDVTAEIDRADVAVRGSGAVTVSAENAIRLMYLEAGDSSDYAAVAAEWARKRIRSELNKVITRTQVVKTDAKDRIVKAEADLAGASNDPDARAKAEAALVAAKNDFDNADTQLETADKKKVDIDTSEAQAKTRQDANDAGTGVKNIGSTWTVGLNLTTQNTTAELGDRARVINAGETTVAAQSSIAEGGLKTHAILNGSGSTGTAAKGSVINVGVNAVIGDTQARIMAFRNGINNDNTLSAGNITVEAHNATNFTVLNETGTPRKVKGDGIAATLVSVSGGFAAIDTIAEVERNLTSSGVIAVRATSSNNVNTVLNASTAAQEDLPVSTAVKNGLKVIKNIVGYKSDDDEDEDKSGEEVAADTVELGLNTIIEIGVIKTALSQSRSAVQLAQRAKQAEEDASAVLGQQKQSEFILNTGISFAGFDTTARVAPGLTLRGDGVAVEAYNQTNAVVTMQTKSEFEEGNGAKVLAGAVNIVWQDTTAEIGDNSMIVAGTAGVTIESGVKVRNDADTAYEQGLNTFGATSVAGSSTAASSGDGDQFVATIGVNIAKSGYDARIGDGVAVVGSGAESASNQSMLDNYLAKRPGTQTRPDLTVRSFNATRMIAEGNAANGSAGFLTQPGDKVEDALKAVKSMRYLSLGVAESSNPSVDGVIGALDTATPTMARYLDESVRQRQADYTSGSPSGAGGAQGYGIGINVGLLRSSATIGDSNSLVGLGNIIVDSNSLAHSITTGVAGTGPQDHVFTQTPKFSEGATKAQDGALGVSVILGETKAKIGTGAGRMIRSGLNSDGTITAKTLSVTADSEALAVVTGNGKASGGEAAGGVAGAISFHDFNTTAGLDASIFAAGKVDVVADANVMERLTALASARGTPIETIAAQNKISLNKILYSGGARDTGLVAQATSSQGNVLDKTVEGVNKAKEVKELTERRKPQSFSAAVALNFADHDTEAVVGNNVVIDTPGAISVRSTHSGASNVQASGLSALSAKGTGAAVGGNLILTDVETRIGNNVSLGVAGANDASSVEVEALSRFNAGANFDDLLNYKTNDKGEYVLGGSGKSIVREEYSEIDYATEAAAGSGSAEASLSGAVATTLYLGSTEVSVGNDVNINTSGHATLSAVDGSSLANKAWAGALALGNGGTGQARGAVGSVIIRGRLVNTTIGDRLAIDANRGVVLRADVLRASEIDDYFGDSGQTSGRGFLGWIDPILSGDFADVLTADIVSPSESIHNQVIGAAAAGSSSKATLSGSLGVAVAFGKTKVIIGKDAVITGGRVVIAADMDQNLLSVAGSLAAAGGGIGGAYGGAGAINVVVDDVAVEIGNATKDNHAKIKAVGADHGYITVNARSETDAVVVNGAVAISGSAGTAGAVNVAANVFVNDTDVKVGDGMILEADKDVTVEATQDVEALSFLGSLAVNLAGPNAIAGTIVSNTQSSDARALLGAGVRAVSGSGNVYVKATSKEKLLTVPVSGGGIAGVLGVTISDGDTRAVADASSSLEAALGEVKVEAEARTDLLEVAGSFGVNLGGKAFGGTIPVSVVSKTVEAQVGNSNALNIKIAANTLNDLRQLAVAGAASTSSAAAAGSLGVFVIDNTTTARIAANAKVVSNGNVALTAEDRSRVLQFGGAVGASKSVGVGGSFGVTVMLGSVLSEVGAGADVVARGLEKESVSVARLDQADEAGEISRSELNLIDGLADAGAAAIDTVKDSFGALGAIGSSANKRDELLAATEITETRKGFVMTADTDHRAVAITLAAGASAKAGVGGAVDVGVLSSSAEAVVRSGAKINSEIDAADASSFDDDKFAADQDVLIAADAYGKVVSFAGAAAASAKAGVGGGGIINTFNQSAKTNTEAGSVIKARRDVAVNARRVQDVQAVNLALAGGGKAGLGAALNVTSIGGAAEARVDGRADALRDVAVKASEVVDNFAMAGAVGGGGAAGAGGAVNVVVADSTVTAAIGESGETNARRATDVAARSEDMQRALVVSAGVGGKAGISASVNVSDARRNVLASVSGDINANAAFKMAGGEQVVRLQSDSTTRNIRLIGGVGGGGGVGAGASFDMASVLNHTETNVTGTASIFAGGDVNIQANSAKGYGSGVAAVGAGGLVGAAGGISINRTKSGSLNAYQHDQNKGFDGDGLIGSIVGVVTGASRERISGGDSAQTGGITRANAAMDGTEVNLTNRLATSRGDNTRVDVATGATITSHAAVKAEARDVTRVKQFAGALGAGGKAGVGLTVGINDINSSAVASLGGDISATGRVLVDASALSTLDAVNFAGGAGGGAAVAGAFSINSLKSNAAASVKASANVQGSGVKVLAKNDQNIAAVTVGLAAAGGLAGAISFTSSSLSGGASAVVGDNAKITSAAALNVQAEQMARISSDALSGAAGAVAGGANISLISENSDAVVSIGSGTVLSAGAALDIRANNEAWLLANGLGVAVGLFGGSATIARAKSLGDARVSIGNSATLRGTSVDVTARIGEVSSAGDLAGANTIATLAGGNSTVGKVLKFLGLSRSTYRRAETFGVAGAGGVAALAGSTLNAKTDNDSTVDIGFATIAATSGDVNLNAENVVNVKSEVISVSLGLAALGAHFAGAENYNDSRLETGARISAVGDIRVAATAGGLTYAESFSLAVGLAAVGTSGTDITDRGSVKVVFDNFSEEQKASGDDLIAGETIDILAELDRRSDARLNGIGVGLVGGGSGALDYDLAGEAKVDLGNNRRFFVEKVAHQSNGEMISVLARNALSKDVETPDVNADLKSYGAIGAASITSETVIGSEAITRVGSGTELYSGDVVRVRAANDVRSYDFVDVNAAAAEASASADVTVDHRGVDDDTATARVEIGDHASLRGGSLVEASAINDANVEAKGEGSAYGAGAKIDVDANAVSRSENIVTIGNKADLISYGEVFIAAGEEKVFEGQDGIAQIDRDLGYRVNENIAASDVLSIVAAAVSIPKSNKSDAYTYQTNSVLIGSGTDIQSSLDTHISADDRQRGGAIAVMDARNYSATAFLAALMNTRANSTSTKSGHVTLDGAVSSGLDRDREITIGGSTLDDVTITGFNSSKGQKVWRDGDAWATKYGAPLGNVIVRAGKLSGTGTVATPKDARIIVHNSSSDALSVRGLDIDYLGVGNFFVGGERVQTANASVLGGVTYSVPTDDPSINIVNSHASGPNLGIDGVVNNIGGAVTITNIYGSIGVTDRIEAGSLNILAGRDFSVKSNGTYSTGNSPIAEYANVSIAGSTVVNLPNSKSTDDHLAILNSVTLNGSRGEIKALGDIFIEANGINVNGLIQSGIQGRAVTLTQADLDTRLASQFGQTARAAFEGGDTAFRYLHLNPVIDNNDSDATGSSGSANPLTFDRSTLATLGIEDVAELALYYDFETERVVARDLEAEGGSITIKGKIASTGQGAIKALDGYARFNIANNTDRALVLTNINTGDGVEGSVIIEDHNFTDANSDFRQTRWVRNSASDAGIVKYQDWAADLTNGLATTEVARGAAAGSYDPLTDQRYQWSVRSSFFKFYKFFAYHEDKDDGEDDVSDVNALRGGGSWTDVRASSVIGILTSGDWERQRTESNGSSAVTVETQNPTGEVVRNHSAFPDQLASADLIYDRSTFEDDAYMESFSSRTVCEADALVSCADWEVRPQAGYSQKITSTHTFSVKASSGIDVGFFGDDSGELNVTSTGDIIVSGMVRNVTGATTLTSESGNIRTAMTDENPGLLIGNQISLKAGQYIGADLNNPFRIASRGTDAMVNVDGRAIFLDETEGALKLGEIKVPEIMGSGELVLKAINGIDMRNSNMNTEITAGEISLDSGVGLVMTGNTGNEVVVDTDGTGGGTLTYKTRNTGNIKISEKDGDLRVAEIDLPGALELDVKGDLLNGNKEPEVDFTERDSAFKDFLDRKFVDENKAATIEQSNNGLANQRTQQYHAYWALRGAGTVEIADYDGSFVYKVTAAERAGMEGVGRSAEDIAAFEAQQTKLYHETHASLSEADVTTYHADYIYELSVAEKEANAEGLALDRDRVLTAVNSELGLGNANGSRIASNIRAGSLNVKVDGAIGAAGDEFSVEGPSDGQLSAEDMTKLRTLSAGEVTFKDNGEIEVKKRVGVSLNADGRVDVATQGNAFIESQDDLKVGVISSASGVVDVKTSGSVIDANDVDTANIVAHSAVVSSAGDTLGTKSKRIVFETDDAEGSVKLRTAGEAYVEEETGDFRLDNGSGRVIDIYAGKGRIVQAAPNNGIDLNAFEITLEATGGIGEDGDALDVETRVGGQLNVKSPKGSFIDAPNTDLQVRTAAIGGISKIRASKAIIVEGGNELSAMAIDWIAPEKVFLKNGAKIQSLVGDVKIVTESGIDMGVGSEINSVATVLLDAKGDIKLGRIVAGGIGADAVKITSLGSINGNGSGENQIVLESETALLDLSAANGVGRAEAVRTDVSRVRINNTGAGGVDLKNSGSLILEGVKVGVGSDIKVEVDGDLVTKNVTSVDRLVALTSSGKLEQNLGTVIDAGSGSVSLVAEKDVRLTGVKTAGEGDIDILSRAKDVKLDGDVTNVGGYIKIFAHNNVTISATMDILALDRGSIDITALTQNVVQEHGSMIHSGLGALNVYGGNDVQLRDVRSLNPKRLRILGRANNFMDDGGNQHRRALETAIKQGRVNGGGVDESGTELGRDNKFDFVRELRPTELSAVDPRVIIHTEVIGASRVGINENGEVTLIE